MDTVLQLLKEGLTGGVASILRITLFLVPVMVVIEIARHFNVLETASAKIQGCLRFLSLPKEAAFPLLAGMFFGIVLGAALIIDYAAEGCLKKRDLMLIGIFLCINHSVIEDTLIFAVFGANPLIILAVRLVLAIVITRLMALLIDYMNKKKGETKISGGLSTGR